MDVKDLALVFQSSICIALIVLVLFRSWAESRLDVFRQRVFVVRDELWDYAAAGNISFEDPAYRLLRQSMNGIIRYAHQLTFFRVCVTVFRIELAIDSPKSTWSEDWQSALERTRNDDTRKQLEEFHARAMQLVANRLIFGSPFLLILVGLSVPLLMLRMGWQNVKAILEKAPFFTVSHVVDTRIIENEAAAAALA